jgi:uncharacterized membrane protein
MNKIDFFMTLEERLKGLPQSDLEHSFDYYNEMIDDRTEEGMTEEEAIAALGSVDEIVDQILGETSIWRLLCTKVKPKRSLRIWEIVLLALGLPVWLPLLISAVAVAFSVYVALWSVVISLYVVNVSLLVGGAGGALWSVLFLVRGNGAAGLLWLGGSLFCLGLGIFALFACKYATKGAIWLGKRMVLDTKALLLGKEKKV